MMKSFFKKLAVVMALAMVVSMVAPAGSALAASKGISLQGSKEIITTYELDKVGATVDLAFQGAPSDWKTTTKWTSSNTKVATVDKDGIVKAVAPGTATITITSGAAGTYKHSVVVTVKGATPVVTPAVTKDAFTVKQTSVDTAVLTFNVPATGVTVDTLEVIWFISDLEIELNKKDVTVVNNVATVVMNDNFVDGGEYIFRYNGKDVKYTASAGELHRVGFSWYTDDEKTGVGQAFVNTDDETATTVLVPHFYDANGVDVTKNYDLDGDFEIVYSLATESESYDLVDNELTFNAISQAVVNMAVTWTDDEGEDHTLYGVDAIVAVKRPAVKFTFVKGGFLHEGSGATDDDYPDLDIVTSFTKDVKSTAWKKATTTWTLGDEVLADGSIRDLQVAAILKDNRGNTVVTGMEVGEEEGQYPFGTFMFASSKDTVLGTTDEGVLSVYEPGRASVLVYFVPADAEDIDAEKVLVGAVKVTIKDERYAATYKMTVDNVTAPIAPVKTEDKDDDGNAIYVANDNLNKSATVVLKVYDQYGSTYVIDEGAVEIKANSATNGVQPDISACGGCGSYGWDKHYHITVQADDFADQVKASSSKSFKYTVTVDKDSYEKLTTKNDSFTIKLTNVNKYYTKLDAFLTDDAELEQFYISGVANKTEAVDLKMGHIHDWDNLWAEAPTKTKDINLNYLNQNNGLVLEAVPAAHILPIEVDEDGKVTQTTGLAGYVYYKDTTSSSKLKGKMTLTKSEGKLTASWQPVDDKINDDATETFFGFAPTGTYKVTLWTAKENGAKLSSKTYTFNVKNSTSPIVYAGYNPETGNEVDDVTSIEEIIKTNCVFTLDGVALDLESGNIARIVAYELGAVKEKSVTIRNVTFAVRTDDGEDNEEYLAKKVRVGKTFIEK